MAIVHIEPGWYSLEQDKAPGVEVGQLVVEPAPAGTVEHWYLYQRDGAGFAAYTQPNSVNTSVTFTFKYLGDSPPTDLLKLLPAEARHISADCSADEPMAPSEQGAPAPPQIDWGRYRIFQGVEIGSVDVAPFGTAPLEAWTLADGAPAYVPPGKGGGSFRVEYLKPGTPLSAPASYGVVYALCSTI